jgi:hypothetical protein
MVRRCGTKLERNDHDSVIEHASAHAQFRAFTSAVLAGDDGAAVLDHKLWSGIAVFGLTGDPTCIQ